jgi:hypothetical protein
MGLLIMRDTTATLHVCDPTVRSVAVLILTPLPVILKLASNPVSLENLEHFPEKSSYLQT